MAGRGTALVQLPALGGTGDFVFARDHDADAAPVADERRAMLSNLSRSSSPTGSQRSFSCATSCKRARPAMRAGKPTGTPRRLPRRLAQ